MYLSGNKASKILHYWDKDNAGVREEFGNQIITNTFDSKDRPTNYTISELDKDGVEVEEITVTITYRN